MYNPATGEHIPTFQSERARAEAERAARADAEARAEAERAARADAEARADTAEARVRELKAELDRLRQGQ